MDNAIKPDWIAVDWGTSNLRAYAMQGATVLARTSSADGMSSLSPEQFEPALHALIGAWLERKSVPVFACGMLGSRQGWIEAPYRSVPATPMAERLIKAPTSSALAVYIAPGLSQANPPDVMRGEETQITGFLNLNPKWDGVLCLPGTHTKWVHLSAGEVVSFQTFMTGELFALMTGASVLRHSVATQDWDAQSFDTAVSAAISKPELLAARLFALRAGDLLHARAAATTKSALSGYLIGAELAAARPYWLGQNLAILGMGTLATAYQSALGSQGATAMLVESERATVAGLTAAYRSWKETT
ncbi:MAG: 2-dehydro-3-deoxygalactonokinase [Roseobacter sp.]